MKCILILSARSSGSSALQNLLVRQQLARRVEQTRHFEHETLFWCKAAVLQGKPQLPLADSRWPYPPAECRADLQALLRDNLGPDYQLPDSDNALIFEGWQALCAHYAPVFVEKSPHHLHQSSALELIEAAIARLPQIEWLLLGLVRNPMDTFYSMWSRWRGLPEANQRDWICAYRNLLQLKERLPQQVQILRYEDLVHDPGLLQAVYTFAGVNRTPEHDLHQDSLGKWRHDRRYGFVLSAQALRLAEQFGYTRAELQGHALPFWSLYARGRRWLSR